MATSGNMAEIPHPFIVEAMQRLAALPAAEKSKVRFIHLNHTNPALRLESEAARAIAKAGFRVALEGTLGIVTKVLLSC